ncbi:unnamed protein product, partial [Iphiclides podalirius]
MHTDATNVAKTDPPRDGVTVCAVVMARGSEEERRTAYGGERPHCHTAPPAPAVLPPRRFCSLQRSPHHGNGQPNKRRQ